MKKILYRALFVILGILLQFLLHALIEVSVIRVLLSDFERYNMGLSWGNWVTIHHVFSILLLVAGIYLGYAHGRHWWGVVNE